MTEDPATGARVGIPAKFATRLTTGPAGSRWSSEQGQLQIETFRVDTGATLEAVFEQQKSLPRRRITASNLGSEAFTLGGMQGLKQMRVYGYARDGEVRGLTILYDQAMDGTMDPLVAPIAWAYPAVPAGLVARGRHRSAAAQGRIRHRRFRFGGGPCADRPAAGRRLPGHHAAAARPRGARRRGSRRGTRAAPDQRRVRHQARRARSRWRGRRRRHADRRARPQGAGRRRRRVVRQGAHGGCRVRTHAGLAAAVLARRVFRQATPSSRGSCRCATS